MDRWFTILCLAASGFLGACSGASDDSRGRPGPGATVTIDVAGYPTLSGGFTLGVGPGEEAWFRFSGESGRYTMFGQYQLRAENMIREQTGATSVSYRPTTDWDWILENRGDLIFQDGSSPTSYKIRTFEYRANPDQSVVVIMGAVSESRIDFASRSIAPADDTVFTVIGRLTGTCLALDGTTIIDDPRHELNPLCRDLLVEGM